MHYPLARWLRRATIFAASTVLALGPLSLGPLSLGLPASAQTGFETRATSAYMVDLSTDTVLVDVNSDIPLPPASMSKLMTLNMLFEALDDGRVTLDTQFTVSERAHAMGGSSMFLETRHRPTVEDLIRGIAILSGNDATVAVAEGLAGTEEAFANIATQRARALGMTNTTIANASGWPHPGHRMSMRDLATLARHIIEEHPQYYPYLAERDFTWNDITQSNRVPLLGAGVGLDGLKTGHTQEAGYGLTGSALQGDRRIIFVFSGLNSERERAEEAERMINYAFRQFATVTAVREGEQMAQADVWMGTAPSVPLVAGADVRMLVPAMNQSGTTGEVSFQNPLPAPVIAGQEVGILRVTVPGMPSRDVPLLAGADVPEGGFSTRVLSAAKILMAELRGGGDAPAEGSDDTPAAN
ncbi:D-alanyl-D-alanine carboxypeptidase family protein [Roseicitreum antarcticum]|uniref:serine-type D-Ala-D-Ala carboxypeptidase n=1 Tax=Roseicitreum antarcticum TaxID=564137 RepID=A0A1H2RIE0_9RHOB|nr:D-alanyl-D-alanine carboxypeptidase family protein [Roseicitreum antarcticum]SDW19243.1 D-alanyl-D-alanine carboxypeptidase (penicillin-binding protein 5/6) [Roseicitreum antarcticum]